MNEEPVPGLTEAYGRIIESIRHQHPDWESGDGECAACHSYTHELADISNHYVSQPESPTIPSNPSTP